MVFYKTQGEGKAHSKILRYKTSSCESARRIWIYGECLSGDDNLPAEQAGAVAERFLNVRYGKN